MPAILMSIFLVVQIQIVTVADSIVVFYNIFHHSFTSTCLYKQVLFIM